MKQKTANIIHLLSSAFNYYAGGRVQINLTILIVAMQSPRYSLERVY